MSDDKPCDPPTLPHQPPGDGLPWRRGAWGDRRWRDQRRRHPGLLFLRFVAVFGLFALLILGGFGLLILSIGAQVVSSHGGLHRFWQLHKIAAVLIAFCMLASALLRLSATLIPSHYFALLGTAALIFDVAMVSWGIGVLRHIGDTVERSNPEMPAPTRASPLLAPR